MVKCSWCGCTNYTSKKEFTCCGCHRRMIVKVRKDGKIKVRQKVNWWDLLNFRRFLWKYIK